MISPMLLLVILFVIGVVLSYVRYLVIKEERE